MSKTSALDRAIAQLDSEIAVLQLAKNKLLQQKGGSPRHPRAVKEIAAKIDTRPA